jgi:hypothetical protein
MQRLEEVRLTGAVGPDDEHEPRLEAELEGRIRPELFQRE